MKFIGTLLNIKPGTKGVVMSGKIEARRAISIDLKDLDAQGFTPDGQKKKPDPRPWGEILKKEIERERNLSPEDFVKEVVPSKGGFNKSLVKEIQEYIANPSGAPEEEGRINPVRLHRLIVAVNNYYLYKLTKYNINKFSESKKDVEGVKVILRYLLIVADIKQKMNLEITGYIKPELFDRAYEIIRQFPARLAKHPSLTLPRQKIPAYRR